MLANLIEKLREELRPLVVDSLRRELEPSVREELKLNLEVKLKNDIQTTLQDDFNNRVTEQARSYERLLVTLTDEACRTLSCHLGRLVHQASEKCPIDFLQSKLVSQIDQLVQLGVSETRDKIEASLRSDMEPILRCRLTEELTVEIATEVRSALEVNKAKILEEFRSGLLFQSLEEMEKEVLRDIVCRELTVTLGPEIRGKLIKELEPAVRHELKVEVRRELEQSEDLRTAVRHKLAKDIVPEVRRSVEEKLLVEAIRMELEGRPEIKEAARQRVVVAIQKEVMEDLRRELVHPVRNELVTELSPKVEAKLREELLLSIVVNAEGNVDGTVGGVLRKSMATLSHGLRESVMDELWSTVTGAIAEAIAAAGEFNDEEIEEYIRLASDLVDDRILPRNMIRPKESDKPDGFYRAIGKTVCSLTKESIEPGDYFIRFKGKQIRLPLDADDAESLKKLSETENFQEIS